MWRGTTQAMKEQIGDVHTRIMKKNYASVPNWWFHIILAVMLALSLLTCEGFGKQLQLPWWGVLLACAMAFGFTLPIAIITATTNTVPCTILPIYIKSKLLSFKNNKHTYACTHKNSFSTVIPRN